MTLGGRGEEVTATLSVGAKRGGGLGRPWDRAAAQGGTTQERVPQPQPQPQGFSQRDSGRTRGLLSAPALQALSQAFPWPSPLEPLCKDPGHITAGAEQGRRGWATQTGHCKGLQPRVSQRESHLLILQEDRLRIWIFM